MLTKSIVALTGALGALAAVEITPSCDRCLDIRLTGDDVPLGLVDSANNTTPRWQCDVRAWTRAPDLSPGMTVPADARLAANGSACGDIVKWEVGMRLKERALIKMRAKGVEFPKQPVRPVWNASRYSGIDHNDVFRSGMYYSNQDPAEREYDEAMQVYQEKLQNASLWFVQAQERAAYDLTREMRFEPENPENVEMTAAFAVHMPPTNFPPIDRSSGWSSGQDEQMLVTETMSEFYHLLTLSNGTVLDIPSGEIGIIPMNTAVKPSSTNKDSPIGDIKWPQKVEMDTTSRNASDFDHGDDPGFAMWGPIAPACDEGNLATFTITVDSNVTQPLVGHNITLNITVTRTGNGSEYPAWLDIIHTSESNITWAHTFVANQTEYDSLLYTGRPKERFMYGFYGRGNQKVRMATTQKELEKQKREKEKRMDGGELACGYSSMFGMGGGPWGPAQGKYEMWDEDKPAQDVYTFGIEVPLDERDFPSFEKTFESVRSSLAISLHTYFACDVKELDTDVEVEKPVAGRSELDKEWDEYELPTRKSKKSKIAERGRMFHHTSIIPFDAAFPQSATVSDVEVVHYLDEKALGPVLSGKTDEQVTFPLLSQTLRDETVEEHKRSRWGYGSGRRFGGWCERESAQFGSSCHELNGGGPMKLASKMWQTKMARQKAAEKDGAEAERSTEPGQPGQGSGFVIQA